MLRSVKHGDRHETQRTPSEGGAEEDLCSGEGGAAENRVSVRTIIRSGNFIRVIDDREEAPGLMPCVTRFEYPP